MLFERKKGYMPSCRIQLCVRKKYPANFPALGRGPCLDERKGGKRKSRHQGCLPSLPDTLKETKRGRGDCPGTSNETERFVLSCGRQSCVRKKYPANCSALDFGLFLDVRDESSSFSFSFLDERKGGKRKSRRQGRLPSWPGTSNATKRVTPSYGRQLCIRKKYPENFPALGRGPCLDERKGGKRKSRHQGCLPSLPDTLKETKRGRGDCPGISNETERLVPSCGRQSCARKKYSANFPALGRGPFLDARKGGKRKSRHQGCLPS